MNLDPLKRFGARVRASAAWRAAAARLRVSPPLRAATVLLGAALLALLTMAVLGLFGTDDTSAAGKRAVSAPVAAAPEVAAPATGGTATDTQSAAPPTPAERNVPQIAVVTKRTALLTAPGSGRRVATIDTSTTWRAAAWRQPRVVPVLEEKDGWLRVIATELANGTTGWIRKSAAEVGDNPFTMTVDLSEHQITVSNGSRVVRRVTAAVGENGTPTPTGRYAVTDRLNFTDSGSVYGCCVLALSAHQDNTPPGWAGDDRVAIHATPDKSSIGRSETNGCMRVPDDDARWLMTRVPLGTVVTIRS